MGYQWYMQAQEILREVKDSGLVKDGFWYIYALIVTSLLVALVVTIIFLVKGFLNKFLKDIKATHAQFAESIKMLTLTQNDLHTMVKLHEKDIGYMKEDIGELKGQRPKRRQ